MEMDRKIRQGETFGGEKLVFRVNPTTVGALMGISLPQRKRGCGLNAGFYRNMLDGDLLWENEDLRWVLGFPRDLEEVKDSGFGSSEELDQHWYGESLAPEVRKNLVDLFGKIIVGLRRGRPLEIVIDAENN